MTCRGRSVGHVVLYNGAGCMGQCVCGMPYRPIPVAVCQCRIVAVNGHFTVKFVSP